MGARQPRHVPYGGARRSLALRFEERQRASGLLSARGGLVPLEQHDEGQERPASAGPDDGEGRLMAYYLANEAGYVDDFASLGGMRAFSTWASVQKEPIRSFAKNGVTDDPAGLAV